MKFAQSYIDEVILGDTNEPEYWRQQNNEFEEGCGTAPLSSYGGTEEVYENNEKITRYKFFTELAARHGDACVYLDRTEQEALRPLDQQGSAPPTSEKSQ